MTLFFSTLFFLVFSDFFIVSFNVIFILYVLYLLTYVFYAKSNTFLLPNKYLLSIYFLNLKTFLIFLFYSIINMLDILPKNTFKWKPLFKRSSYFGLYRSIRNQWLNK